MINKRFENYISLGYFCSVAIELDNYNLRKVSYPFDWCIVDFEGLIDLLKNNFKGLLFSEYLYQSKNKKSHYYNKKFKLWFYHDFDAYQSLNAQLPNINSKYMRRINRFYSDIKNPSLFIRYISDEITLKNGKSKELDYIEKNIDSINLLLKSYNNSNEIIFIANENVSSNIIKIYNVPKDKNDNVNRFPFHSNNQLDSYFRKINNISPRKKIKYSKIKNILNIIKIRLLNINKKYYKHERVID